jgi:hypothetical protein
MRKVKYYLIIKKERFIMTTRVKKTEKVLKGLPVSEEMAQAVLDYDSATLSARYREISDNGPTQNVIIKGSSGSKKIGVFVMKKGDVLKEGYNPNDYFSQHDFFDENEGVNSQIACLAVKAFANFLDEDAKSGILITYVPTDVRIKLQMLVRAVLYGQEMKLPKDFDKKFPLYYQALEALRTIMTDLKENGVNFLIMARDYRDADHISLSKDSRELADLEGYVGKELRFYNGYATLDSGKKVQAAVRGLRGSYKVSSHMITRTQNFINDNGELESETVDVPVYDLEKNFEPDAEGNYTAAQLESMVLAGAVRKLKKMYPTVQKFANKAVVGFFKQYSKDNDNEKPSDDKNGNK